MSLAPIPPPPTPSLFSYRAFRQTSSSIIKYLLDAGDTDVFMISSVAMETGSLSWKHGALPASPPDMLGEVAFTKEKLGSRLIHLDLANYTTFCPAQLQP